METFVWNKSFSTGLDLVDEQHHGLIDLINRFGKALMKSRSIDDAVLQGVFGELTKYANYHFSAEENLMLEFAVESEHLDMHLQQHAKFVEQVLSMWKNRGITSEAGEALHDYLCGWLAYHVLSVDQEMGRQIAFIKAGKTPAKALELSTKLESTSTQGLLSALRNLHTLLAEQHLSLMASNEHLGERVKEIKCLHEISKLTIEPGKSSDGILQSAVNLIPPGWFYPEITVARIVIEGREFSTESFRETPWRLSANIVTAGKTIGTVDVCYLEERPALDEGAFLREERGLINDLAQLLGSMVKHLRSEQRVREYVSRLERATISTVTAISQIMDMRDPYTAGHQRRVGATAAAIAVEMGLGADVERGLRIAGSLHDVGKITVPAEVLAKPGKLSALEYEMIKKHAEQGYEVLKDIDFPWPVAEVALQHHERIDGSGYPHGLRGDEILSEARILAVADVMEAMASHRPYRPSLGIDKALAEIERGRGTVYGADEVDACLRLFQKKGFIIPD